MMIKDEYYQKLLRRNDSKLQLEYGRFFEQLYYRMLRELNMQAGSRVLDAGCGAGAVTPLLAERVGEQGRVVGIDIAPLLLQVARSELEKTPFVGRVSFQEGDLTELPFENAEFDLVWCSRVMRELPDPLAGLREIRRVLKTGGSFLLREDSAPLNFLPFNLGIGKPGLEERLLEARLALATARQSPESNEGWLNWPKYLGQSGFQNVTSRAFLLDMLRPWPDEHLKYLVSYLQQYLEMPQLSRLLEPEDHYTLRLLIDPSSRYYVLDLPDLHIQTSLCLYYATA